MSRIAGQMSLGAGMAPPGSSFGKELHVEEM